MHPSRRVARALPALLLLMITGWNHPTRAAVEPGVSAGLAQHRASVITGLNYRLSLSIPLSQNEDIPGTMRITLDLADAERALQVDFREDPRRLLGATINGRPVDLEYGNEHILVPPQLLRAGSNTLDFRFLAGPTSLNRNPDFLYTLFVPDRARTAFPLFDQPDLKATWDLSLTMPADWQALSSAPVARTERADGRKTVHFATSDRISTYAFSFVAGDFEALTKEADGHRMTMLHRETDAATVARNVDEIFRLHAAALAWLEAYTGISHPYQKLDFALLPAHPYGGMEHVGAIQYRSDSLMLDEGASDAERLGRASLIAHEVAHMWFGNLVTMRWFDDVWTKEVFANFMAAKIVNPAFPTIDHELNFLVDHHPGAYAIDRTAGANAIRQELGNLNQAGQLYGPIIYDKAPIMMRQLERLLGEERFRNGLREYLRRFAHANASWPELIAILDEYTQDDVGAWSDVWVNSPGRPRFRLNAAPATAVLEQRDPAGKGRVWPQSFGILDLTTKGSPAVRHRADSRRSALAAGLPARATDLVLNADGYGYGLFPADLRALDAWRELAPLPLASLLINLNEQMLEAGAPAPGQLMERLLPIAVSARDQLLLDLALDQLRRIYWTLLPDERRRSVAPEIEDSLWAALRASDTDSLRKIYFSAFTDVATTPGSLQRIEDIWSRELIIDGLPLSERDDIRLTRILAIKNPAKADAYLRHQLARTENPDERRRLAFQAPSLAADRATRAAFFASLRDEENRSTEPWVLDALANLHHPLRVDTAESYLRPGLELLEEIQATGDIFFPARWLRTSFRNHHSAAAAAAVTAFLEARPDYNPQLRMKIQQAADPVFRASRLRSLVYRE